MEFIKEFGQIGKGDAATAGGKGASLGEMTSAGIPVPPGFVILSGAFERFLDETDLNTEIDTILHSVDQREMGTVEKASERIQALILNAKMPEDIAATVQDFYTKLDTQFVAVRSSATAEDSASAAWAGQLDSFLNTTEETLLANVQKCWASLFTPRAIFYRYEKELHTTKISVAVVVQKMVQSEVSGIAFSVHPVTEDYNQLIIEAGFGLGEAIVSGSVTPDSYIIEKEPRRIIDKNITYQSRALWRAENGGNEWRQLSETEGNKPALSDDQVLALAEIILRIESHYGFPCDIEWAYEAGTFYITQSRPITTLTSKGGVEPISPELEQFLPDEWQYLGRWKSDLFAGYFWTNWFDENVMMKLDFPVSSLGYLSIQGGNTFLHKKMLGNGLKEVYRMIADKKGARSHAYRKSAEESFTRVLAEADAFADREPTVENFKHFVRMGKDFMVYWVSSNLLSPHFDSLIADKAVEEGVNAMDVVGLIPKFPAKIDSQHADAKRLLGLLKKNSLDTLLGGNTEELTETIDADKELKNEFQKHLKEFGWIELINYVGTPLTLERLIDQLKTSANTAEHTQAYHGHTGKLSKEFQHILNIAADVGFVRQGASEVGSEFHYKLLNFLNRTAETLGLEYQEMMNLTPPEIIDGLDGGKISHVELRKLAQKRSGYNWVVYTFEGVIHVLDDQKDVAWLYKHMVPTLDEHTDTLVGQIGNRGKKQGRVSVILANGDFPKFVEGNVLVTTMTTPDFVILMQKSVAIVTDIGGMLSHASIVSRELHKPCVIGTKFATQVLHDGDLVEVDADSGVVRILERAGGEDVKKKLIEEIKNTDWHSDWSGPFSLFGLSLPTNTYFDGMEKYFGKSLSHVFIAFKKGIAFSRIPDDEYHELGAHLIKRAQDKEFVKEWASQFKKLADKVIQETAVTAEEYIKKLSELLPHYQAYGAHSVATKVAFDVGYDKLSPETKELLEDARKYSETFYKNDADNIEKALHYLAKKTGYAYEEVYMLTYDELLSYFDGGSLPAQSELKNRWMASGVHFTKDKTIILSSGELAQIEDHRIAQASHMELSGQTAYKGRVRGKCRIVLDYKNAVLEKGEILVTGMTDPNFVELMKKAAGIITDGGGTLSHAAIVARELKKPCIIGTKFATQILHDGDLVEVDADNGMVRILERVAR